MEKGSWLKVLLDGLVMPRSTDRKKDLTYLFSLSSTYLTGGRGPLASFKVNFYFPRFHGLQHMYSRWGVKLFSKGVESNCLSIELVILFLAFYFCLSS